MEKRLILNWRVRLAGELVVLTTFLLGLKWHEAPEWAYVLLIYVGTRCARIDMAADFGALQSTLRANAESDEEDDATPD